MVLVGVITTAGGTEIPHRNPGCTASKRVTHARLAVTALVVLLLSGSLLASYVVERTTARPQVFLPTPLSTEASPDPSPTSMPGAPTTTSAATDPGLPGALGTSNASAGPGTTSVAPEQPPASSGVTSASEPAVAPVQAFSPSLCDSPPPDDLPVTPLAGAAQGVSGLNLQSGWSYFTDGSGFHIAVPDGWTYQLIGTTHCFRSPRNARTLTLDAARDPAADPVTESRAEESRLAASGELPDYALIGVNPVPLLNKAADWEYRYRSAVGATRHAVFRWFVMGGRAYALGWSTTEKAWTADLPKIQMIRSTFYSKRSTPSPQSGPSSSGP